MSMTLLPKSRLGRYSILLTIVFVVVVIIIMMIAASQGLPDNPNGSFFDHKLLAIMTIGAFSAAFISLLLGLITIFKNKEKSMILIMCMLIDVFAVYFAIAEIVGEITNTN